MAPHAPTPRPDDLRHWQPPPRPDWSVLEGRYTRLERLDPERHAAMLFPAFDGAPEVWTYLPEGPVTSVTGLHKLLRQLTATPETHFFVAIHDKQAQRWGGFASYWTIQPQAGAIELGWIALSPALQRRPAATEAFYLMMKWAFETGYRRFEWKCDAKNAPSRRAGQRLGLSYEGVFRQAAVIKGRNRDTAWFAAVDREWPALEEAFQAWLRPENFDAAGRQRERLSDLTRLVRVADDPMGAG